MSYFIYLEILFIAILILLNGYLSMAEIAIVSSKKITLQKYEQDGNKTAKIILDFLEDPNEFLSAIQIGITLIGILTGALGGATLAEPLAAFLNPYIPYATQLSFVIVVVITTYFSLLIGEIVPKRIALNDPEKSAMKSAKTMHYMTTICKPLVKAISGSTNFLLRLIGSKPTEDDVVTQDEVKLLIAEGIEDGTIEKEEESIIKRVFRLDAQKVDMIMTPRNEIIWIDLEDDLDEIQERIIDSKRSIFPIAEGELDDFLGVIQAKDVLSSIFKKDKMELRRNIKEPLVIPDQLPSMELLKQFKQNKEYVHMSLVVDEFGTLEGLITLNDLLEGIVGDIPGIDENNDPKATKRKDGSYLIDGRYPIDTFAEIYDLEDDDFPSEEDDYYTTLAGFILSFTGKIPEPGDIFHWEDFTFKILAIDGHHIDKVLVMRDKNKKNNNENEEEEED
ncbi:MAG: hemolysin family protein [Methanobacteriaceae archaeon]|jgi:putative hemolysin|uniref:hemolysin family protein n=1 Tax=unclassified Methanobrevibacter TaxID=2638681 RepID=UPI0037658768|nr:hemolysin family protein [Methanobacteriaceae archaeon]MDD4594332.1 hemolysin family protein [Methanobacteriaceae archaeon]